jgi:D-alanyl-lipoteichoic acid acyltransferase DltB (MBOAT superfamily)
MLFNSYEFIFVFLPITFGIYFYLNTKGKDRLSKIVLVFASLLFYSWWNVKYLPLIVGSILFNYAIGKLLRELDTNKSLLKKELLIFGLVVNVALLGYFKYADFFIENINTLFDSKIALLHLMLPLAISFFTFQQIAYLVDSYKMETKEYDFLNYTLFVTFFPQLIAGPIVHHKEMMPQFAQKENLKINYHNILIGLFIFSMGLFKKVVIADTFAVWATNGFDVAKSLNLFEAWATSLSYTFQLYFDFSGYTDMAIGAALLFNIKLPANFNSPYKATDIQDFWRRWHITLSRFLRDYIYIPLGGNKKGDIKTYINLFVTFLIGGLWHGASWMFVIWGAMHGMAIVIHRIWKRLKFSMNKYLAWFITFNFINITWIFFRAKEWDDALKVLNGMFNGNMVHSYSASVLFNAISGDKWLVFWLVTAFCIILVFKNTMQFTITSTKSISLKLVTFSALLFSIGILSLNKVSEFLYFNF